MELTFKHRAFEEETRKALNIYDRPITADDVLSVGELDLSEFSFDSDDLDVLARFRNLRKLAIDTGANSVEFWHNFSKLEELFLICWWDVDFESFGNMKYLENLLVSGGDYSSIDFQNLDAVAGLEKLEWLTLHEFGRVDIAPLAKMKQIKHFTLAYPKKVINIEAISRMIWLQSLSLIDITVENLDFLDTLPDSIELELCGIHVNEGVNLEKLKRFKNPDICEVSEKDGRFEYIDLSTLKSSGD